MKVEQRTVGDVVIFDIEGVYSREEPSRPSLADLVKASLKEGKRKILFNLEKADIVSDNGMGDIISSYVETQKSSGRFVVVFGQPKVPAVFRITMLDKFLEISESVSSALTAFSEK